MRFELTTNDPITADDAICQVLVRWATGKRLTHRLPNLSLTTLSPPGAQRGGECYKEYPGLGNRGGESVIRNTLGWVIDRSFTPIAQYLVG